MKPARQDFSGGAPPYTQRCEAECYEADIQNVYINDALFPDAQCSNPQGIPPLTYQGYPTGHMASPASGKQTQTTIVMTQPKGVAPVEVDNNLPPNYMALSIMSFLCCFFPFGLIAIIKSRQVDAAVRSGNLRAAREASKDAKRFIIYSIAIGAGITLGMIAIRLIMSH